MGGGEGNVIDHSNKLEISTVPITARFNEKTCTRESRLKLMDTRHHETANGTETAVDKYISIQHMVQVHTLGEQTNERTAVETGP